MAATFKRKEEQQKTLNFTVNEHEQNMEVYEHHVPFFTQRASCGCRLNIWELTDPF